MKRQIEKIILINIRKNSYSNFETKYKRFDLTIAKVDEIDPGILVPNQWR